MLQDLTAIIVNWCTPDLLRRSFEGLLKFYPRLRILLIDNGSADESVRYIREIVSKHPNVAAVLNKSNLIDRGKKLPKLGLRTIHFPTKKRRRREASLAVLDYYEKGSRVAGRPRELWMGGNVGHGPAVHQALGLIKTPYAFGLDSDCIVQGGGFLELMLEGLREAEAYSVGRVYRTPHTGRGFSPEGAGFAHVHTSVILWDVAKYLALLPYVLYGVPSIINMRDAATQQYPLVHFDIGGKDSPVYHPFRGSRKRFHQIPFLRSMPIMPRVLLDGLESDYIGWIDEE